MSFDALKSGVIISYPYLWDQERKRGETEGRKKRPTAVGLRIQVEGAGDLVVLFPITSKEPERDRVAVEIPEIEKRRGGLDADKRLWIILDDANTDEIGKSYYLEADEILGRFSKAFFVPLMKRFIAMRAKAKVIDRRD